MSKLFGIKPAPYKIWRSKEETQFTELTFEIMKNAMDTIIYGSIDNARIFQLTGSTLQELYIEEMNETKE